MTRSTSPFIAAIAGSVMTAVVISGVAIAQTGTAGVITACVAENTGNVRIVSSATDCRTNERSTSWNEQGQPGPTGPAGPARFVATLHNSENQVDCVRAGERFNECAAVTVHVPANTSYVAGIDSAGSFYDSSVSEVSICSSARRLTDPPEGGYYCSSAPSETSIHSATRAASSVASNGAAVLTGGPGGTEWVISTAVVSIAPLHFHPGAVINTLVMVSELR